MKQKHAIITGASSGIGLALSRELARRGYLLALLARRESELVRLAEELKGSVAIPCDVTDRAAVDAAVRRGEELLGGPFDLAVANAGISIPTHANEFNVDDAEHVFRVNVLGALYLFGAVIPSMIARRSGRFAGVASIAGLRGLPTSAVYSASKAALQAFLEGSRVELRPFGVGVTIVNPGYVDTPILEKYRHKLPFLMSAPEAAAIIADGIDRGERTVEFPLPMSLLMRFMRIVPASVYDRLISGFAQRRIDMSKVKR